MDACTRPSSQPEFYSAVPFFGINKRLISVCSSLRSETVSYTHLDVYKRQAISLIVMLVAAIIVPFGLEGLAVNAGLATRANLSELQVKAVSYTHLDVYKRQ